MRSFRGSVLSPSFVPIRGADIRAPFGPEKRACYCEHGLWYDDPEERDVGERRGLMAYH
jgi:hypothetical protein